MDTCVCVCSCLCFLTKKIFTTTVTIEFISKNPFFKSMSWLCMFRFVLLKNIFLHTCAYVHVVHCQVSIFHKQVTCM